MPNRGDYQFLFFGCLLKKMIDYRFKIRILRMRVWSICDQYVCVWFEPGPNHIGNHKHHFINHIKQQTNKQQSYLEEREKETTIFENDIWERPKWTTTTTTTTNYHHQRSSFFDVQKQRKHNILKQTDRETETATGCVTTKTKTSWLHERNEKNEKILRMKVYGSPVYVTHKITLPFIFFFHFLHSNAHTSSSSSSSKVSQEDR